jgi:large subunit ribosomal protein L24
MPLNTSNLILNLSNWGKRVQRVLQKPSLARKPAPIACRWNIVRGDIVEVTQGPQQGQRGKVKAVLRSSNRVIVEGVNLSKRYLRSRRPGKSGRTVIMPASVHYSNVHLIDPVSNKPTKISRKYLEDGTKVRVSKLSGQIIPKPDFSQYRKPRSFLLGPKDTAVAEVEKVTFADYAKYLPFIYKSKALGK